MVHKMYHNQIIRRDIEFEMFERSLTDNHKVSLGDGLTIVQRAVMEHNMSAIGEVYANIYFSDLGDLLGVSTVLAEQVAAKMISNGSLTGSIDQVENLVIFHYDDSPTALRDSAMTNFCVALNRITELVRNELQ